MNHKGYTPQTGIMSKTLCPRCLTGVDDDNDGNCGYCARLSDAKIAQLLRMRLANQQVWIDRATQYLYAAYENDCLYFTEGPGFILGTK